MRQKLIFQNLIFISLIVLLFSCGGKKTNKSLAEPNDSLANIQAVREISKEIENNPEVADLYYRRGQIFTNEKYLNRAEDDYLEACKLDSTNALYFFVLARTQYAMNQTMDASKNYEKAILLKPDYLEAILKLGDLYFVVKEHEKSIAKLNQAMKLDAGNARIYHMLGMNYREMGDTSRAIYHFQTAIENDAADYESNLYLANLYAAKHKEIAFEYFKAALKLKPKSVEALFGRAVFEQEHKLYKAALLDYRKIIDLDPQNYLSYYNVGYINYENGMMEEALRNWNTCTQMNTEYANAYYMKGLVYEELKKYSDASLNYRLALELEPENALFNAAMNRIKK
jgi:tetratricopeptide (TPR) repeat protein